MRYKFLYHFPRFNQSNQVLKFENLEQNLPPPPPQIFKRVYPNWKLPDTFSLPRRIYLATREMFQGELLSILVLLSMQLIKFNNRIFIASWFSL